MDNSNIGKIVLVVVMMIFSALFSGTEKMCIRDS